MENITLEQALILLQMHQECISASKLGFKALQDLKQQYASEGRLDFQATYTVFQYEHIILTQKLS